jgi:5-methylcytosine-specific restriction endonuclease McrA
MKMGQANGFQIDVEDKAITVVFAKKVDFNAIRQLEFSSRLMYGLKPNENNVWKVGERTAFHIVGFPPTIQWHVEGDNKLVGSHNLSGVKIREYVDQLSIAISSLCPLPIDGLTPLYRFSTTDGNQILDYEFNKRARAVCALAVLYDLEWHPRKDLEIWINFDLTPKLSPRKTPNLSRGEEQFYGDPSKTADELRNEGWPREAEEPLMLVESRSVAGQTQQHYRLVTREQVIVHQKKRSNIKPAWRTALYEQNNYTCQICLSEYHSNPEQLSPDHRVPVIYESDNLDDENFRSKLMTLCRYCNQSKREFTKRLAHDYDWNTSPWAYPERYRKSIVENQLRAMLKDRQTSYEEILAEVLNDLRAGQ